jgi:F-type H+-transporting ATPase subunit delta
VSAPADTNLEAPHTPDVATQRIAKTYAQALFNLAGQRGQVQEILDQFESMAGGSRLHHGMREFFLSQMLPREQRKPLLQKALQGRCSDLFADFIMLLNDKGRLDILEAIAAAYRDLMDQQAGRVRVSVRSASPMTNEQQDRLRDELRASLNQEPILKVTIDPELLGGLVVQVGDQVFDASVRTRLDSIRNQLMARGGYEIQHGRDRFSIAGGA